MWSLCLICDLVKSLGALQMRFCRWSHLSCDPGLGGRFFFWILTSLIKKSIMWSSQPRKTLSILCLIILNGATLIFFHYLQFVFSFLLTLGKGINPFIQPDTWRKHTHTYVERGENMQSPHRKALGPTGIQTRDVFCFLFFFLQDHIE